MPRFLLSILLFLAISGVVAAQESAKHSSSKSVTVDIVNSQGHAVGTATLSEDPNGVKIKLDIKSLPAGPHLMHIHEFAICDPPDFKSAGAHFNPTGAEHNHAALPAGDIPNFVLTVKSDRTAHTSVVAPSVTFGPGPNSIFNNGGTALVIHAVAAQVSESAPPRIACAVIARPQ